MLTEHRVHELAAQLANAGHAVTLVRIREANGHTGSLSTISRHLATWRENRSAMAETEARRDPAIDALERLAPGTYARVVARVEEQHRNKLTNLRAELDALQDDRGALVSALASSEERVDELATLTSTAQGERSAAIDALATVKTLSAEVQALASMITALSESSLATRSAVIEAVAKSHAHIAAAHQATELELADLGERLRNGLARVQEQMTADHVAADGRNERELDAIRASAADQTARLSASISAHMQSLAATHRSNFVSVEKAIAGLRAATRMVTRDLLTHR